MVEPAFQAVALGWNDRVLTAVDQPESAWHCIALKAGFWLDDLKAEHGRAATRKVSGFSLGGFSVQTEPASSAESTRPAQHSLETMLSEFGEFLADRGTGLLVTIDQPPISDVDEVRHFGSVFPLASRRAERPIAFAGAALPALDCRLMTGPAGIFLQRCHRHELGNLAPTEVELALRSPKISAGARIDDEALRQAVEASNGQPYFVELIGARLWGESADPVSGITVEEAERAVEGAIRQFGEHVYAPVWHRLSDLDKRFLTAMLSDRGSSAIAHVGDRWGTAVAA